MLLHGRRITVYAKTRRETQQKLWATITTAEQGLLPMTEQVTVERFLAHWLDEIVRHTLSVRTHESYGYHARLHIVPHLGALKLKQLQSDHLQRLYTKLFKAGLSPKTVRNAHGVVSSGLQQPAGGGWLRRTWPSARSGCTTRLLSCASSIPRRSSAPGT